MKVIRTIPTFYPIMTGPANQAFHISRELEKKNIKSPIITSTFKLKEKKAIEKFENVTCLRFKSIASIFQYSITPTLIRFLLNEHFDLIHAHSYRNFQTDIAFLISKVKKLPLLINPHGTTLFYSRVKNWQIHKTPYRLYDLITFRSALRKADAIIAASKQEFNEIKEFGISENKIRIVPAGINIEFPKKEIKNKQNSRISLLFVGRISRDRRIERLLKAFGILLKKYKNIELSIVGGEERRTFTQRLGYLTELKNFCKKLKINQKVHFTGFLSKDNLRDCYMNSDVFIYPSDYENFGQTILEAAAAGLPLICTPVGIANEIIEDGQSGFFTNGNPREMADKIEFLIVNEKERNEFGQQIQKFVKNKYQWEKITREYIKIYANLLETK